MTSPRVLKNVEGPAAREATVGHVRAAGEGAFAVWQPDRGVSYGPRDRRLASHGGVRSAAEARGYDLRERPMGGRPVVLGPGTLAFVWAVPDGAGTIPERYEHVRAGVREALGSVGIEATPGTARRTFCPGEYGLFADGKVAGFAQRVRKDVASVGGLVIVEASEELLSVLTRVYAAIGEPFDSEQVGSVATAGGPGDVECVRRALVATFHDRTF